MANVELRAIRKRYGNVEVVHGIDLEVRHGEFVVFVGPSGCGKSTLLRMVAGLEGISDGELRIDGQRVNELPPRSRDIAMVFQDYALYPHKTLFENMAFGLRLRKTPEDEIQRRVMDAARLLKIEHMLERRPAALSGGQRQRVAIAKALATEAQLIVLDEAVAALDVSIQAQVLNVLAEIRERTKVAFLFITHDLGVVRQVTDEVLVLRHGRMVERGRTDLVLDAPQHRYTQRLLASVPGPGWVPGKVLADFAEDDEA
jgi:multiple sugar transport system ATP-binding protein